MAYCCVIRNRVCRLAGIAVVVSFFMSGMSLLELRCVLTGKIACTDSFGFSHIVNVVFLSRGCDENFIKNSRGKDASERMLSPTVQGRFIEIF